VITIIIGIISEEEEWKLIFIFLYLKTKLRGDYAKKEKANDNYKA